MGPDDLVRHPLVQQRLFVKVLGQGVAARLSDHRHVVRVNRAVQELVAAGQRRGEFAGVDGERPRHVTGIEPIVNVRQQMLHIGPTVQCTLQVRSDVRYSHAAVQVPVHDDQVAVAAFAT